MTNWIVVPVKSGLAYTKAAVESFLAQDRSEEPHV